MIGVVSWVKYFWFIDKVYFEGFEYLSFDEVVDFGFGYYRDGDSFDDVFDKVGVVYFCYVILSLDIGRDFF